MGSEAQSTLTQDDGDGTPASCLLSDFCDNWRRYHGLTDVDYWRSGVRKFHCPRNSARYSESELAADYDLSMCYAAGADGWTAIKQDWHNITQLPLPEVFNGES